MMEFAKSLSGHDKNRYYVVLRHEGEYLQLVNGINRPLEKPKKKNEKHIQIIKKLPSEIEQILAAEQNNLTIKKAIKEYEKLMSHNREEN